MSNTPPTIKVAMKTTTLLPPLNPAIEETAKEDELLPPEDLVPFPVEEEEEVELDPPGVKNEPAVVLTRFK